MIRSRKEMGHMGDLACSRNHKMSAALFIRDMVPHKTETYFSLDKLSVLCCIVTYPSLIYCCLAFLTALVQLVIAPLPVSVHCLVQVSTGAWNSSHLDTHVTRWWKYLTSLMINSSAFGALSVHFAILTVPFLSLFHMNCYSAHSFPSGSIKLHFGS